MNETSQPGFEEAKPLSPMGMALGAGAILAAFAGVFILSHGGESGGPERAEVSRAQTVTVAKAQMRPFARALTFSGEVRPVKDIRVHAPAQGVRILELLVDEGAYVKAGQPLARLDTAVAQAQILSAQAALKEAEVSAARAADEYKRAESIRDSGALSAEAIDSRKAQAEAAAARASAARAQLNEVSARLQGGYVRAPSAGLVLERTAQLGAPVDGQSLFRIAGDNRLEVAVEVSEADMLAMKQGQAANFTLVDGSAVNAKLRRAPASIDAKTRTGEAVFELTGGGKARAGMSVRGQASLPQQDFIAAPQTAVKFDGGQAYLFVVDAENKARRMPVQLGPREGELVAVLGGLEQGARVIASGAAFVQDGDEVSPVEPGAVAPASAVATKAKGA
jgi:HlyD family secretion protein